MAEDRDISGQVRTNGCEMHVVVELLNIADDGVTAHPDVQPRAELDGATVEEYAGAMRQRAEEEGYGWEGDARHFPPLVVFYSADDPCLNLVADGFHRLEAARRVGAPAIRCEIHTCRRGTDILREARLYAVGANAAHGLRRSNADKRRAVMRLLEDPEWSTWSNREIARRADVSKQYVWKLRKEVGRASTHLDDKWDEEEGRYSEEESRTGDAGVNVYTSPTNEPTDPPDPTPGGAPPAPPTDAPPDPPVPDPDREETPSYWDPDPVDPPDDDFAPGVAEPAAPSPNPDRVTARAEKIRAERRPLDAYYTPDELAEALVGALPAIAGSILEPHVGGGAFARALRRRFPKAQLLVSDVNPDAPGIAEGVHVYDDRPGQDFLEARDAEGKVDWIVGNPPYDQAEAHVRKALGVARVGVAFLLRLAFLESAQRVPFWQDHPPAEVHVLSERPSFTDGGTDNCAYGWFIWRHDLEPEPELHLLSWRSGAGEVW